MSLPSPTAPVPDLPNAEAHHVEASLIDSNDLTNREVRSDPILAALARRQGQSTGTPSRASSFKARPAPANMGDTTVGPRMTKAAALRQGLKWEETRRARPSTADAAVKPFGTKRSESTAPIKSLAAPSFAPRPTKSSQLRTGEIVAAQVAVKRDPAEVLAANKAKAAEEKLRRRASIALPASLSAPSIAPRGNKSSELRAGGRPADPPSSFRPGSALRHTTAANVGPPPENARQVEGESEKKDEKAKRRVSMMGAIKSLGAPSIQPRLNKAAMLRAPGADKSSTGTSPAIASASSGSSTPKLASAPSTQSFGARPTSQRPSSVSGAPSAFGQGPRPTRASLLRAGLGAKVQTR